MTNKVQKVREKVEKLKSQLLRGACSSQIAIETRCKEEAYNEVLGILDFMQEEPISEDLEKAASRYAKKEYNHKIPATLPDRCRGCYAPLMYAFKAGANWQKQQIMKNSLYGEVTYGKSLAIPSLGYFLDNHKLDFGDKVKVIIIKDD